MDVGKILSVALESGQLTITPEQPVPFFVLRALRHFVRSFPTILSQAAHLDRLLAGLSIERRRIVLARVPTWFHEFDQPFPGVSSDALERMGALERLREVCGSATDPVAAILEDTDKQLSKNADDLQELLGANRQPDLAPLSSEEASQFCVGLSLIRANLSNLRCMGTYGQSMGELLRAGEKGIDEGFKRALSIDSAVLGHPKVIARMAAASLAKEDDVVRGFQDAAQSGPSKKITPELNECRAVLGQLRQTNLLPKLSAEQLYQLLCEDLQVYPVSGKDPAAGLKVFIKRWEESLVQ